MNEATRNPLAQYAADMNHIHVGGRVRHTANIPVGTGTHNPPGLDWEGTITSEPKLDRDGHAFVLVDFDNRSSAFPVRVTNLAPARHEEDEQGYLRPIDPELQAQQGACPHCGDHHDGECFVDQEDLMDTTPRSSAALFTVDYSYTEEDGTTTNEDLYSGPEGGVEPLLRSLPSHKLAHATVVEWNAHHSADAFEQADMTDVQHYDPLAWLADRDLHPLRGNARPEVAAIEDLAAELGRQLANLGAINSMQGLAVRSAITNLDTAMRDIAEIRHEDLNDPDKLRAHFAHQARRGQVNETAHYASSTEEGPA